MDMDQPVSLESYLEQGDTPKPRDEKVARTFKRRSTNIELQKSIQLLDEAVSPTVGRLTRTPRGSLRHSTYTPKKVDLQAGLNSSDFVLYTPGRPLSKTQSPLPTAGNSIFHGSMVSKLVGHENTIGVDFTEDLTQSNITYLAAEEPGLKVSEDLYETFKDLQKSKGAPHRIMELLSDFESACAEKVMSIRKLTKGITRNQPKFKKASDVYDMLRHEKETWQLIASLYKDRLETEAEDKFHDALMDNGEESVVKPEVWSLSEENIANRLFEKDSGIRQSQLVIDWLESCASEELAAYSKNANFFVDQPVSWENTLHHLQKNKKGVSSSTHRPLVQELDPDAPRRQERHLDDLDKEDERHLLQNMYICLRAGHLEKAQELCQSFGEPWRAATLEGWRLLHDPNYYSSTTSDTQAASIKGNVFRDVWKAVCWRMAADPEFDKFERALYAALSGNLQALLPVCISWMDYLWAYYKVMVDVRVEQEIQLHHHTNRQEDNLPSEFWDKLLEPHDIFKEIAASVDEDVRHESEIWHHIMQKHIILRDIPALIEVMYSWLPNINGETSSHLLRLMCHIVLFLRTIGESSKEELCESIIEAYVDSLIKNKHKSLVALYVAALSPAAQVQWYAKFLEGITETEERQRCLMWAEDEGLNVALITKTVVEHVRARDSSNVMEHSITPDLTITEEDRAKIDAIDWLLFDRTQRPEAVKQANAVMRSFIVMKKHAAARQVFEKLPADTVDVIFRLMHLETGSSELSTSDSNAIREYMCMKAYLDAVESFNDWFALYHQGQPNKPNPIEGGSFTDRVAMEHRMKQYEMERERWMHDLLLQSKTTRDRIYNVLLFADGGWLVDAIEDPEADESRQHQMNQLRKLHLPSLCLNLHTVLHSSGLYAEAVQMADVIACEMHQLYKEFSKESLQHFLRQISKSSHKLLYDNKDPLGYELV